MNLQKQEHYSAVVYSKNQQVDSKSFKSWDNDLDDFIRANEKKGYLLTIDFYAVNNKGIPERQVYKTDVKNPKFEINQEVEIYVSTGYMGNIKETRTGIIKEVNKCFFSKKFIYSVQTLNKKGNKSTVKRAEEDISEIKKTSENILKSILKKAANQFNFKMLDLDDLEKDELLKIGA